MKRPHVLLAALFLALALSSVEPAGSAPAIGPTSVVQGPNEWRNLGYGTCRVSVLYGTYGTAAYAKMRDLGGCQASTSVAVVGSLGMSHFCSNWMRLGNPYPGECGFNPGLETQATSFDGAPGWGAHALLCWQDSPSTSTCNEFTLSPWG